jgi:UDP-N-acetylmuramoyl-tripeptide--D-alanyl-D-alanine ligase
MMLLSNIASAVNGRLEGKEVRVRGVTTDSRADCTERLFVALKGENFDAHDFIRSAENRGAAAVLVERSVETCLPTIHVANTGVALSEMAAWWRAQFAIPVIGITGSVGKTTVKEMVASIFAEFGKGLVTKGNLNNEIGVPLTLLRLESDDLYAVIEMGMNRAGEIDRLSKLTKPTIALINNAAAAHLEELGTVAAVAEAKGEIFSGLQDGGTAIINADDRHIELWRELAGRFRIITFGLDNQADIGGRCELYQRHSLIHVEGVSQAFTVKLSVPGKHNVRNALAAIAVALAAQVPVTKIIAGLAEYRPIAGRLNLQKVGELTIIDDTYNANPASMQAAIDVLAEYHPSTLIVGDMAELGASTVLEHRRLGEIAAAKGIDQVLACGQFADQVIEKFAGIAHSFKTQDELLGYLARNPVTAGTVLVKGSRSAKMEQVVKFLVAANESQSQIKFVDGGV